MGARAIVRHPAGCTGVVVGVVVVVVAAVAGELAVVLAVVRSVPDPHAANPPTTTIAASLRMPLLHHACTPGFAAERDRWRQRGPTQPFLAAARARTDSNRVRRSG
jgi:hypothetical protein